MLVDFKKILNMAENDGYAIPAFNVYNMETVVGVIAAAEECKSPVILQTYSRLFTNEEAFFLSPMILKAANASKVPVCFHLDHGAGYHEVATAIKYGCTGVMIDASMHSINENIAITKNVTDICNGIGVYVEGELGHIGSAANGDENAEFTTVDDAVKYVRETAVTALAIMVGTAHGHYKKAPKLAIDRIKEIKNAVKIPLVLHGGSGVPDDQIKAAVEAGIRKINFGTDVCYSFLDKVFETSRDKVAIDLFMKNAISGVKEFAISKIKLLGAENRA